MFQMAHEDKIAQAVHFGVSAQYRQSKVEIALAESVVNITQHLFQAGGHQGKVANILEVDAAADRGCAVAAVQQEIANALQTDDELQAGQEFARMRFRDLGDHR